MTTEYDARMVATDEALTAVRQEIEKATRKHRPMASPHEGWAVIKEELDELWEHVMKDTGRSPAAYKEALQVSAMGIRYIVDLITARAQDG